MWHPAAATVTAWVLVVMVGVAGAVPSSRPSCPRSCSCPQPSELHCTFRSLHSIPAGISKQVERINLGFNAIHTLTETSLAGLRQLELLMIHGNNIHELPHRAFTDLNALQMLKMSYNKLVELDRDTLHGLWSLARLHLDHNRLEFIHPDAFQGLTALRLLQLEGNRLQRLHPATFCTFSLAGGHLHASTLRHLHLSDNALTTLEPALLASMPRLENLYLHGNPWTCDCRMRWFHHWDSALSPGVLKCKKDRAYPGGELCALCSSPRHLRSKELQAVEESMICSGPVIARSSSRQRTPGGPPLADDTEVLAAEEFREPLGNVSLGLSDEHGNQVDLACAVGEPRELARVDWEQVDATRLSANASLSVELDCPVDRDSYELLWRLIAYYSDVPAHLKRDSAVSGEARRSSYTYRQDMERDALYYTGVRVNVAAAPAWLMQPSVDLQLDRPQSTGKSARLVLRTRLSQTVQAEMARRQRRSWVAIESTNAMRTTLSIVAGGASRMDCRVRSSEPAAIRWMLPDGTQVQAPSGGSDDRLSVSGDGTLAISPAGHSDAGMYYCIAAVHGDLSVLPFRLAVEESSSPPPGGGDEESSPPPPPPHVQGFVGEPVTLPCAASGSPDAHIDWILPGGAIVSFGANSSRVVVFSNGTLRIARAQPSDGGYYKCVAVNQHGVDALATRVALSRRAGAAVRPLRTFPARPQSVSGVNTKVKVPTLAAEEEASGDEDGTSQEEEDSKQRGGSQNAGGGRGGHPSRTMWRRPATPRRPAAPNANDRRNAVIETRRRINNKIDPAKWADILAKIRDKTAQSNATASPTTTERRKEGVTGRQTPSSTNMEGSSEVDTTSPPATTERRGEAGGAHAAPVTPNDPGARRPHGRTHVSRGKQHAQRVRFTADTRRKTADARDTAPDRSASASPLSTAVPQRAVTDWQARVFSTSSSAVHDSSVRQPLHDVTTADAVTTTADSSRTSERSESSVSSSSRHREVPVLRGSRLNPLPTTDEPPATEERQDETTLAPRAEPEAHAPLLTTLSPTTMPARRLSGKKKGSRGRGPTHPRPPNSGRRGGRRKQRPDRRKQRPDRPGRFTTATPAEAPLATAPMRLKIEPWGKAPSAAANDNSAVPFTGGQATSPGPLSHKASTVSGHDDRPAAEPPTTPSPPPPASLPLTKHSLLPPAKPPLRSTSVAPLFPTTSPGAGRVEMALGASTESEIGTSSGVSTPAAHRRFTSAPLLPVKPLEETQRGSVLGDLGPVPRSDESVESARVPVRVQPDVVQSYAPTEAAEKVPFKEMNVRLFPSAAPSVQREINRPSGTNSESDWITTTTTAAAGGIYKEDALETTKRPVVSQSIPLINGEERTAHIPSDGDNPFKEAAPASVNPARHFMSTTPATAKSSPLLPSERRTPHATVPVTTPAGGRTGSVTIITREGPKFNQIPDSHSERAQRPEQRTPLSPGRDPLVIISSRPVPDRARASFPATHSDGQNVVVFRSTTKPSTPKPTVTQAVKQTATVHRSHTDTARSTPARTDESRAPTQSVSSGHHLPGTAASSRGRPRITNASGRTVTVAAEADAQLPCEAVGEPMPFLSWTKVSTGASVAQNTRVQRFEVHPNGTLVIRTAQPADRGQYLCMVQNQYGSDKVLVTLAVMTQHPRVLQPRHRDATVPLGGAVDLECAVTGHPTPRVTWVLPDRVHLSVSPPVIPPHQRVALFNNGTLRITQASYADRGVYKCIGSSPVGADTASVRLHVTLLPPVIQQAQHDNATLPEGGAAFLHCSARGTPEPAIRWTTPDGLQLAPSQFTGGGRNSVLVFPNGTLYVRGLTAASAGRYECTASSALASSRRVVTLTVVKGLSASVPVSSTKARIVSSSPQRTDVMYGGTVQLDCLATGQPEPRIIWRTPSKKLVDSQYSFDPRIKVFANGTLTVRSATDADSGDYLCVARNKMGDDYVLLRAAVLTRAAKIERKRPQSSSQEVAYGGDLKVDCVASGLPDPEISWALPDGTMVNPVKQEVGERPGAGRSRRYVVFDNGTLYFNEVGMREEGDYTCYAQNQLGKDEMKVRVRVKVAAEPPRIRDKSPKVVRVPYGEAATLSCSAEGEPAPIVSWTSPTNRAIPPAASDKYQVLPGGTLVVHKAQRFDGGNYTCSARNAAGTDRRVIAVEVLVTPPTIGGARGGADGILRVSAVRDQRLTVDCEATGSPVPRLMWVLPENVILPAPYYGGRMTVHRNGTLDIRAPKLTDSGRLACVARNEGGETRLTVHLDVREEERPRVRGPPATDVTLPLTVGNAMALNCSFEGGSAPRHVTWLLPNGTPLLSGARLSKFFHRPSDGALVIGNPSVAESGVYRCLGRGATGLLERQVTLTPGRKPHISNRYNSPVSVLTGEDLLLHCAYGDGAEPLRLSWTLPSGVVLGRPQRAGRYAVLPNGTLSVRQASVYDRGSYMCRAANEYGGALLSVAVAVLAFPPRITSGPPAVTYARRGVAVQLNCAATGTPRAEVAWETPDRQRLAASGQQPRLFGNKYLHPQGSLVIQNPTQRDAGVYRCTARNAVGVDSKSTYLNVF